MTIISDMSSMKTLSILRMWLKGLTIESAGMKMLSSAMMTAAAKSTKNTARTGCKINLSLQYQSHLTVLTHPYLLSTTSVDSILLVGLFILAITSSIMNTSNPSSSHLLSSLANSISISLMSL